MVIRSAVAARAAKPGSEEPSPDERPARPRLLPSAALRRARAPTAKLDRSPRRRSDLRHRRRRSLRRVGGVRGRGLESLRSSPPSRGDEVRGGRRSLPKRCENRRRARRGRLARRSAREPRGPAGALLRRLLLASRDHVAARAEPVNGARGTASVGGPDPSSPTPAWREPAAIENAIETVLPVRKCRDLVHDEPAYRRIRAARGREAACPMRTPIHSLPFPSLPDERAPLRLCRRGDLNLAYRAGNVRHGFE